MGGGLAMNVRNNAHSSLEECMALQQRMVRQFGIVPPRIDSQTFFLVSVTISEKGRPRHTNGVA